MKLNLPTAGISFTQHVSKQQTPFERLFEVFKELITHTSGDFDEAIDWLRELDKEYGLTNAAYTIDDFVEDLLQRAYIQPKGDGTGEGTGMSITSKTEKLLREHALKQIFGKLKKSRKMGQEKNIYDFSSDLDSRVHSVLVSIYPWKTLYVSFCFTTIFFRHRGTIYFDDEYDSRHL